MPELLATVERVLPATWIPLTVATVEMAGTPVVPAVVVLAAGLAKAVAGAAMARAAPLGPQWSGQLETAATAGRAVMGRLSRLVLVAMAVPAAMAVMAVRKATVVRVGQAEMVRRVRAGMPAEPGAMVAWRSTAGLVELAVPVAMAAMCLATEAPVVLAAWAVLVVRAVAAVMGRARWLQARMAEMAVTAARVDPAELVVEVAMLVRH